MRIAGEADPETWMLGAVERAKTRDLRDAHKENYCSEH